MTSISMGSDSDEGSILDDFNGISRGCSSPPSSISPLDELPGDDDLPAPHGPHVRQLRNLLPCPFLFLGCSISFNSEAFDDWYAHGVSHFGDHQPPRRTICFFCDTTFQEDDPWRSWKIQMYHVASHLNDGSPIEHAQPDFALLLYLKDKNLITDIQYKEATQEHEEGLFMESLRPRDWISEEQSRKKKAEQQILIKEVQKPEKKRGYKGKNRAVLSKPQKAVVICHKVLSKQQETPLELLLEPCQQFNLNIDEASKYSAETPLSNIDSDTSSDYGISDVDSLEDSYTRAPPAYGGLPSGHDVDEDLMDPKGYSRWLKDIRNRIFENSIALQVDYMPEAARNQWNKALPLDEKITECRAMLQQIRSNVRTLRDVRFSQNQLSFLKIDPQRTNVALLIAIPIDNILRLGNIFEESQSLIPQTLQRQPFKNRLYTSRKSSSIEPVVQERTSASPSSLNHYDCTGESPENWTRKSKSPRPRLPHSVCNENPRHSLFRLPDQAKNMSPLQDPVSVRLNSQEVLEDWPQHGALITTRNSVVVICHGKRHWDPSEPRLCDYREVDKHVDRHGVATSSKSSCRRNFPKDLHNRSGARSCKMPDKELLWNTLAEECKALFELAQMRIQSQDIDNTIYTVLRTLDLITLTYAGAHVAEIDDSPSRFGQKRDFFKIAGRRIYRGRRPCKPQFGAITLARRSLKCLEGFFSKQKVWVFHEETIDPRNCTRLLLSTTPEDFADIWGHMWRIKDRENPSRIIRFDLENGSIISSGWNQDASELDVSIQTDEELCHWLSDSDLRKSGNSPSIPDALLISKPRLLVGAKEKVRLRTNKEECKCTAAGVTKRMRNADRLRPIGTSRDRKCIEAESVGGQLNGVAIPISVNYTAFIKTTAGRTFKESLIKRWTLEKHKRNPYVLLKYRAVEMSFCTENSRRIRLLDLLTTRIMSRLIEDLNPINNIECKKAVNEALELEPAKIINLYLEHPEWKDEIGNLISCCLDTLVDTGTTQAMGEPLSVFWMFGHEEYILRYPPRWHRWCGFIKDDDYSGAFVVLEEKCLVFKFGRGCGHPPEDFRGSSQEIATEDSVLETSIIINDLVNLPAGLKLVQSKTPEELPRWKVKYVAPGSKFSMGNQGTLEIIQPLPKSTLLVKFIPNNPIKQGAKEIFARFTDKESKMYHVELETDKLDRDYPPIGVFIIA